MANNKEILDFVAGFTANIGQGTEDCIKRYSNDTNTQQMGESINHIKTAVAAVISLGSDILFDEKGMPKDVNYETWKGIKDIAKTTLKSGAKGIAGPAVNYAIDKIKDEDTKTQVKTGKAVVSFGMGVAAAIGAGTVALATPTIATIGLAALAIASVANDGADAYADGVILGGFEKLADTYKKFVENGETPSTRPSAFLIKGEY
jgi:hypothetical protein